MSSEVITVLYIVGLFALLYFLLIRPQQQRQKKHTEMIKSLQLHDAVVTAGGIFGTIVRLDEDTVQLRVADDVKLKVMRNSIAQVESNEG